MGIRKTSIGKKLMFGFRKCANKKKSYQKICDRTTIDDIPVLVLLDAIAVVFPNNLRRRGTRHISIAFDLHYYHQDTEHLVHNLKPFSNLVFYTLLWTKRQSQTSKCSCHMLCISFHPCHPDIVLLSTTRMCLA